MPLNLSIIKAPVGVNVAGAEKSFSEQGGTLGRGDGNDWVLGDPDRFLSSRHCSISFERGRFFVTDTSTNGTFVNGSTEPLGKGAKTPLNTGDTIEIGDYQFRVDVVDGFGSPSPFAPSSAPSAPALDPFDTQSFSSSAPNIPGKNPDPFAIEDDFFGTSPAPVPPVKPLGKDPFGFPHDDFAGADLGLLPDALNADPLAALDKVRGGATDPFARPDPFAQSSAYAAQANPVDPLLGASYGDQADALSQSVVWPEAKSESVIPEDWDEDFFGSSSPALEPAPAPRVSSAQTPVRPTRNPAMDLAQAHRSMPLTTPPIPPQKSVAGRPAPRLDEPLLAERRPDPVDAFVGRPVNTPPARPSGSRAAAPVAQSSAKRPLSTHSVDALLDGLGLSDHPLSDEQINEIYAEIGELMPVIISGMMQILRSRASIKNEFRMNVTTIQPIENNPLKFSADPAEAVENMFVRHSGAYMGAKEAFQEGFNGIGEHQVAIIAGIRAGFRSMMDRFNPEILERQFEKQNKGGLLPGMQKARYWNSYVDYYQGFVDNMENTFQYLFGDEFVQAYEEQLRRLAVERKKKQHNDR